jgi:hypothetical protein
MFRATGPRYRFGCTDVRNGLFLGPDRENLKKQIGSNTYLAPPAGFFFIRSETRLNENLAS